jgi:hypothetical protein
MNEWCHLSLLLFWFNFPRDFSRIFKNISTQQRREKMVGIKTSFKLKEKVEDFEGQVCHLSWFFRDTKTLLLRQNEMLPNSLQQKFMKLMVVATFVPVTSNKILNSAVTFNGIITNFTFIIFIIVCLVSMVDLTYV